MTELRFFESGPTIIPQDERVYRDTFHQSTTRSVVWDLNLVHPSPEDQVDFAIVAVYSRPDGSVLGSVTHNAQLDEGSTLTWTSMGWGWAQPGKWPTGLYQVDLSVKTKLIASGEFEVVDEAIPNSAQFLELRNDLPWSIGTLSYDNLRDLESLSVLARKDIALAVRVGSLPWLQKSITSRQRGALEYMAVLTDKNPVLASELAARSWMLDDISQEEWNALKFFTLLSGWNNSLARTVAAYPWLTDQVSADEWQALERITFFAREDEAIGSRIAGYSWIVNGINGDELMALEDLRDIATQDVSLVRALTGHNWIVNDITEDDRSALWSLKQIVNKDLPLARYVAGHAWVSDGIAPREVFALNYLKDIHARDASLGNTLAGLPWFADNISEQERWALQYIDDIAKSDVVLAKAIVNLPWLRFDLSQDERWALRNLGNLLVKDASLAKQVAAMPFFTASLEKRDRDALAAFLYLSVNAPSTLALMVQQSWFLDGVDDGEAAFIIVLGTPPGSSIGPENLRNFVRNHRVETRTVNLPPAEEVRLILVRSESNLNSGEILDQLESGIRLTKDLMGVPFPKSEVLLLFAAPLELKLDVEFDYLDIDRETHILINPNLVRNNVSNPVLIHNIAHSYWGPNEAPLWFREGTAEFLTSYLDDNLYGASMKDRLGDLANKQRQCDDLTMHTIQRLIDRLAVDGEPVHKAAAYFTCNHSQGENLFIKLFDLLGSGSFRSAWQELYLLAQMGPKPISEKEIYQAFLGRTTEANASEFKELYSRLHGGSFAE